ncbi:MAG: thioredoxin family protein [Oscillospiraceae bacterium]|nr:thioredoxin family protein [Oscillospiraceae bacterium]
MTVGKVNIDDQPELAARYGVEAIPTVVLFRDGGEARRFVGLQPKRLLEDAISATVS